MENMTFEEVVDFAAENELECLEAACWPGSGSAKRRYAGVCHIDAEALTDERAEEIKAYCKKKNVAISSLGYYPNMLDADLEKRDTYIKHLYALIDASVMLDVYMVTTFLGRITDKTVEENLDLAVDLWTPILEYARERKVKIAIENCPMLFTKDEWPGGQNLMTTPAIWRKVLHVWRMIIWESIMIPRILSGSRLII